MTDPGGPASESTAMTQPTPVVTPFKGLRPAPSAPAPSRRAPGHRRPHRRRARRVVRRARRAGVPRAAGDGRGVGLEARRVRRADDAPRGDEGGARGGLPVRHGRGQRGPLHRRRPHREGAPPPERRAADRERPDALPGAGRQPRAPHAVHQLAGRCAVGCPFCATGELGHGARPRDRGDRRPGAQRRAAPRGRGHAADERRVHGHGRAAAQPRPGARVDLRAQRPAAGSGSAPGTSR